MYEIYEVPATSNAAARRLRPAAVALRRLTDLAPRKRFAGGQTPVWRGHGWLAAGAVQPGANSWLAGAGCGAWLPRNICTTAVFCSLGWSTSWPPIDSGSAAEVALERARRPELDPAHRDQLVAPTGRSRAAWRCRARSTGRLKSDDGVTSLCIRACTTRCWRSVRVMSRVARVGGVADAGVGERVAAVQVDRALAEVPDQAVERHRRDHLVRVVDRDAAERVDQVAEAREVDQHHVVHAQAGQPVDGADQQRRPAEGERRVDLVRAVAGDRHVQVARDREHRDQVLGRDRCARAGSSPTARPRSRSRRGCPSP